MKYTLVKPDGTVGPSHDFPDQPPQIAAVKGRWLPDNPPAYDQDTQKLKVSEPVNPAALSIPYQIKPLGANQIAKIAAMKDAIADAEDFKADNFTKAFAAMTKQDLNDYIDANVTSQQDTKQYLKKLSRMVLAMVKQQLAN